MAPNCSLTTTRVMQWQFMVGKCTDYKFYTKAKIEYSLFLPKIANETCAPAVPIAADPSLDLLTDNETVDMEIDGMKINSDLHR